MEPATPPDALGRLAAAPELRAMAAQLDSSNAVCAVDLWGSSVAAVLHSVQNELHRPILLVCGHLDEADDLADDLELFSGRRPMVMPALELAGSLGRVSQEQVSNRLRLVRRLADSQAFSDAKRPLTIIASIQSLMQSVASRQQLEQLLWTLKPGQKLEPEKLIVWLSEHGYNRLDQVEVPGDFAVRGGIVDLYLPGEFEQAGDLVGLTIRIDFFDDSIESIRRFDLDTLGSGPPIDSIGIPDIAGAMPDVAHSTSLLSYLPPSAIIAFWQPLEISEQATSHIHRLQDEKGIYPLAALLELAKPFARMELWQFDQGASSMGAMVGKNVPPMKLPIRSLQRFETETKKAMLELAELAKTHSISVFCENVGEKQRLHELLEQASPGLSKQVDAPVGYLHRGFVWEFPDRPIALLGHHELFHRYELRRRTGRTIASRPVDSFLDLKVGDYVVHVAHGIARFTGIQTLTKEGQSEEYLTLRFAEQATLHVPASRINLVQKYIGGFQGHPKLSRLGSGVWEKQKAKVSEAVMDLAAELIDIQAARNAQHGTAYPPDTDWQREFEAEFPYEPTEDQITGSEQIKQDMAKPRPM
ncbi:MAG TPA: CarD family transcriptional regulator, partial [Tepidisphaeraceae bacterium]|nr:CarD family transcriptional regulator [Tepidisphaeraceae bacterium]